MSDLLVSGAAPTAPTPSTPQDLSATADVVENGPGDAPELESDIRLLDELLDATILRLEGEESLRLVEEIRAATQQLRTSPSVDAARALRDRLSSLDISRLRTLTRAFSLYFDLINLAEQQARVRALRKRASQSPLQPLS